MIAQFILRPSLSLKNTFLLNKLTFNFGFYVKMIYLYYLLKVLLFFKQLASGRKKIKTQPSLKRGE